jgi:hypothetical protein
MAKKAPTYSIRTPGQKPAEAPEKPAKEGPRDDRIALTLKLRPRDYERLMTLKGRRRQSVQAILEEATLQIFRDEGV